jgi:SAM-dependent methyltransferase
MQIMYSSAKDYITGDSFVVWGCVVCGVCSTELHTDDLSPYYPAKYRRYTPIILTILKTLYRMRVSRWSSQFTQPGYAYEMGCADGFMLDALRQKGWRVLGSERNDEMLVIARENEIPVFAGEPESLPQEPTFDLIILFQVLEHLPDPAKTLKTLSGLLKPGGRLVIGVPNHASWQAGVGREKWFHLDVPRHLFHYTPDALKQALARVELTVVNVNHTSFEHDPFGWVQTVLNRLDTRQNRLTRLLMRMDKPDALNLLHLALGALIGLIAIPVSILSWWAGKGALMQVTAQKPNA